MSDAETEHANGDGTAGHGRIMVASDSLPERNGVGAYYRDLIEQLREHRWTVGFIGPSDEEQRQWRFSMPGDETQNVWIPAPRQVGREIRALAPQLMVVATPGAYGMLALWWARHLRIPLIVGFHTDFPGVTEHYRPWLLRSCSRGYFSMADRMLFRNADRVLGNSEAMLQLARERGARDTALIGTLVPECMLRTAVTPLAEELQHVLFAGRLAPEKNIQSIIDAAEKLPGIRFTIAGDGPLHTQVVEDAGRLPNLEYRGWVSREDLMRCMDEADLLVLPSELESFGNVALEAMARQRLVLVSGGCGIIDWPDLSPALFRIGESESLAEAIAGIASLPSGERQGKAETAREAAKRLNRESLRQWEDIFRELIGTENREAAS